MKRRLYVQITGMVLILFIVVINLLLTNACMDNNTCHLFDTFGWGFINGIILVMGLVMLGG